MTLRHHEQVGRLNGLYDAWVKSAARQGVDPAEIALPQFPVLPPAAEGVFERSLSDNGEGPGDEGNDGAHPVP